MSNDSRPPRRGRAGQTRTASGPGRTADKDRKGLDATTISFLVIVLAVIAGSVYFFTTGNVEVNASQEFSPSVTIEGEALPAFDSSTMSGLTDPAVGAPAPTVTGQDFFGEEVSLLTEGEATIISFLAHWCPHCQAELPLLLEEWVNGDLPDGVNIAAVPTGSDPNSPNWPPSDWLLGSNDPWDATILADTQATEVAQAYGLSGYPFFAVVGADGNILARSSGELGREQLQALVDVAAGSADAGDVGNVGEGTNVTEAPAPESSEGA